MLILTINSVEWCLRNIPVLSACHLFKLTYFGIFEIPIQPSGNADILAIG